MQFVYQSLTWGFLLAFLPVLIHLINLVRRRRVKWAAMEFLQQSYRRHRKWIWLKQWLLLLTRMAIIALVVALVAQWVSRQQWLALLGGSSTHHYLLLDDSYSMSERTGAGSAMDSAKQAISQIAEQAMLRTTPQKFTLIRFSRAAAVAGRPDADAIVDRIADLNGEQVDARFNELLEEHQGQIEASQLAAGPRAALELVNQLLENSADETNLIYLLSDFRENQWSRPAELKRALTATQQVSEAIHLVRCSKQLQANLAITDLRAGEETRAAGVPLFVHVSVRNFGTDTARRVPVRIRSQFYDPQVTASAEPGRLVGTTAEPPAVLLDEVPPGQTITRRVQVYFPQPGAHVVEALLPEDAVAADNRRWCVLDIPAGEPALIIDGSLNQRNAYFLTAAFQPGQRANSGVRPEVQPLSMLRDTTAEALRVYRAIYLADVDQVDERVVENLENYLKAGGGLAVFAGPRTNLAGYTQRWYREGAGLLPLPLERSDTLPPEMFENVPDFEVQNHSVFSPFVGEQGAFLRLVSIQRYLRPPDAWKPDPQSTVKILATLRNRQPLVVERQFGRGRVVLFLTTLQPEWNNWAHDPSFVVVMLRLHSYLASTARYQPAHLVGTPLPVMLDMRKYRKEIAFVKPGAQPDQPIIVNRSAVGTTPDAVQATAVLGGTQDLDAGSDTQRSGIYEAWPATLEGAFDVRRFALNVDPQEGNLALASRTALRDRLRPLLVAVSDADQFSETASTRGGYNRSLVVMSLLLAMLLGEQWLAYSASYHAAPATAH